MEETVKVYHGSHALFNKFDEKFIGMNANSEGKGFYFTNDYTIAEGYAGETGYIYEVLFKGKKSLSSETITMTRNEVKFFLKAIHEEFDYLYDWGDVDSDGIEKVLETAIEGELSGSSNDVDIIAGVCNLVGDNGGVLNVLFQTLGYDSIIVDAQWGRKEFKQTLYIALISNIIEILNVSKREKSA